MLPMVGTHLEPSVLIATGDPWTLVVLRAELLERGYEARGIATVTSALLRPDAVLSRPPGVVVVEQSALSARDRLVLEALRAIDAVPATILLSGAGMEVPAGPWDRVLHRPITIGAIASAIDDLVGRPPLPYPVVEWPGQMIRFRGFDLRLGLPWPMIGCRRCNARRHCDLPETWHDRELVRLALVRFVVEHEDCAEDAS